MSQKIKPVVDLERLRVEYNRSKAPIMIGVVSGDMVHADFAFCLTQLFGDLLSRGYNSGVGNIKATLIDQGRNMVVREALRAGCSHLLCIDSDMAFPPDAAARLLSHDKDIVGVTYCTRRAPFLLVHHNFGFDELLRTLEQDSGIYKVKSLPCGMMLIKMSVFKAMLETGNVPVDSRGQHCWFASNIIKEEGEDVAFCRLARKHGFDVWLDVDLSRAVRHCGQHYYSIDDAKPAGLHGEPL
jgi:hypothetical protein